MNNKNNYWKCVSPRGCGFYGRMLSTGAIKMPEGKQKIGLLQLGYMPPFSEWENVKTKERRLVVGKELEPQTWVKIE